MTVKSYVVIEEGMLQQCFWAFIVLKECLLYLCQSIMLGIRIIRNCCGEPNNLLSLELQTPETAPLNLIVLIG